MGVIFCSLTAFSQKTVFWPNEWNNPNDDFYNRLSYDRSYQSDNFVIFWGDLVGTNPANYSDPAKRFNPVSVADTLEAIYDRFITELGYVSDDPSTNLGKYKIIIVMLGTFTPPERNGFAFGGSYSNTIGAMWVDPSATRDGGALSHELVHSLQNMHRIQENPNPGGGFVGWEPAGFFYEGHANYMRTLMYQRMANTDVPRWLATRSYHWSSTRHHYANFHLLYYVQEVDGFQMTTRLWKESVRNEHPLMTLRRLKGLDQEGLNDYLWGYAQKQATFDYKANSHDEVVETGNFGEVIRNEINNISWRNPRFLWKQYTILDKVDGASNRYVVNDDWAPQDYGVNVIRLHPTCSQDDKKVFVKFKGHTEVNNNVAGWRYGFVTSKPNGTVSRYSEMHEANEAEISFELLDGEEEIFLVVMGAPKEHTSYVWEPGYPKIKRYPYEIAVENALPEGHQDPAAFRSTWKTNGHLHSNGGGWVSNNANVASSVYVGPYAVVRSGNISGNVRIEGHAWVEGATVRDNVIIRDNACVFRGTYSGNAIVEGNAFVENGGANTNALVTGNVFAFGSTYGGDVVMGGDSENGTCSNGVYLQFPHGNNGRTNCDGQGASHWSNQDVNASYSLFSNQQMAFTENTSCDAVSTDCAGVPGGNAYVDDCGKCVGGTSGQVSDDADNDGILDCEDACPNDPNKIEAGICGCGVADNECVSNETFTFTVNMDPMSDYTATTVQLDGNAIAAAFNMTQQELVNAFGNTVTYAGVEPNGNLNPNSTANAPGHWYDQGGNTVAWGANAYVYAELNSSAFTVNIGQYPDRSEGGDSYTIRQALIYSVGGNAVQVTLVYNISINQQTAPDADNDGTPDSEDACPNDPNKSTSAGVCGCGNVDTDIDNDGICDTEDNDLDNDGVTTNDDCDDGDANIGAATTWYADGDNDGLGDAATTITACNQPQGYVSTAGDECPADGNKTTSGECGCGVPEGDCTVTGNECNNAVPFDQSTVYSTPYTTVLYDGKLYQNKWYAYGALPSAGDPWQLIGFCSAAPLDCSGKSMWSSTIVYSSPGIEVIYDGELYENQWYTQGQTPGQEEVWRYLGPCTAESAKYAPSLSAADIYPNPTTGNLYLNKKADWVLYDMTGQELERGAEQELSLSGYDAGVYLLRVDAQLFKVIKE